MNDRDTPGTAALPPIERRLRRSGILLLLGLLIEAGTLFALDRPVGFLTFAGAAGLLVVSGIGLFLWAIVSPASPKGLVD